MALQSSFIIPNHNHQVVFDSVPICKNVDVKSWNVFTNDSENTVHASIQDFTFGLHLFQYSMVALCLYSDLTVSKLM